MSLQQVRTGQDVPDDVNVIIEIPLNSEPVKYEVDKETGAIFVDRMIKTAMRYPCNYGYIPHTLCGDGDPVDVLVIMPLPLIPGSVVRCRPIGMLKMTDEAGEDDKIVAVPIEKITGLYRDISDVRDLPDLIRDQIAHFFITTRIWSEANGSRLMAGVMSNPPRTKSCAPSNDLNRAPIG